MPNIGGNVGNRGNPIQQGADVKSCSAHQYAARASGMSVPYLLPGILRPTDRRAGLRAIDITEQTMINALHLFRRRSG